MIMKLSGGFTLVLSWIIISIITNYSLAQDHQSVDSHGQFGKGHRLTPLAGYAFIDNSFSEETNYIRVVPAFGINYDYFINSIWGLGIHSDILLQQFKIEKHGHDEKIGRENPIALCGMFLYKPHHRWTTFAGYGVEIEKHENFQLIRIGAEYGIELPKHWELGFSLEFDYKPDAYNSLLFGIGFSKILRGKSNIE